jgi:uncharacterized lipoprotein YajG
LRILVCILCTCFLFGGCALVDSTLTLEHKLVLHKMVTRTRKVVLIRVVDRRPDRGRIGCKKNGLGSETADLFLDVPLTDWFGGVINEEFKRSGLVLADPEDREATQVEVDLLDFFAEPDIGFSSHQVHSVIHAEVTVRFPDGTGYARKFAAKADDSAILVTDGDYTLQLEEAMRVWVHEAVTEIIRLIEMRSTTSSLGMRWRSFG